MPTNSATSTRSHLISIPVLAAVCVAAIFGPTTACASRDDCLDTCAADGRCEPSENGCIPANDADCRAAKVCEDNGQCHAALTSCVAISDADCLESMECKFNAKCSAGIDDCIVRTDADCKKGLNTRMYGKLRAKNGACVLTDEGCSTADLRKTKCKYEALCSANKDGSKCVVAKDADCRQSLGCERHGQCAFADGACIADSNDDCAKALFCNNCKLCGKECAESCAGG